MKQTKMTPVEDKVFKKDDILKFASILSEYSKEDYLRFIETFDDEAYGIKRIPEEYYHGEFTITIRSTEGTVYTSDSIGLLKEEDIIDRKKIEGITIFFKGYPASKSVEISFSPKRYTLSNQIAVSSDEAQWFNRVNNELNEVLIDVESQDNVIYKQKVFVGLAFAIIISISLIISFLQIYKRMDIPSDNLGLFAFGIGTLSSSISMISYSWLIKQVDSMWSSIEFDFGPEHLKKNKKMRKAWGFVSTAIIIPILLSILFLLF